MPIIENKDYHPYLDSLADKLIKYTRERTNAEKVSAFSAQLHDYDTNASKDEALGQAIRDAATMTPEQKLHAARALAAEQIVLNSLGNMYRRMETPSPEERFTEYFTAALTGMRQKPATREEQKAFVETLKAAHDKMIISVVQTMHPTIYHSGFARKYETEITEQLEGIAAGLSHVPKNDRAAYARNRQDAPLNDVKRTIDNMVDGLMSGKESLTPDSQVTVVKENELDRRNHVKMQNAFSEVVLAYNRALDNVSKTLQIDGVLDKDLAEQMRASPIKDSQAVWRTWAYGADADGRDLSTSIVLYDGIHHHVEKGNYIGRKRDLRENAKDQKQSVSCLIQRAARTDPDFAEFCSAFLEDPRHKQHEGKRISWKGVAGSTSLQLSEPEQSDLYRDLIVSSFGAQEGRLKGKGFHLVPVSLKEQTIAFNEMFGKEYRTFLEQIGRHAANNGPLPDLSTLTPEQLKTLAGIIKDTPVEYGAGHKTSFDLDISREGSNLPSLLYSPKEGENSNFFEMARKTVLKNGTAELTKLEPKERRKLLDVVKRLAVLDDAYNKFGDKVADRYQVANFENASDFYASLLLFKEAGIIEVKDHQVVGTPKLSLQPLLETEQDQKNAVGLFTRLLDDHLVQSYYRALGNRADMMVGYSDGAKSAGNLASEWSIYKCERDLKKVFADKGITLNFFHGRGRGDSRGGQFDEGQNYRAAAPELHQDMRYDETIQSDGPMNGAISKGRGEDMLTSIVTGIVTAKRESDVEMAKRGNPAHEEQRMACERAMDFLAGRSKDEYLRLVANNKSTMDLLNAMHDNNFKSSRAKSRKAEVDFDNLRAISVEYGFNMADAPLHYIGMQKAMKEFIDSGQSIPDEKGRQVKGAQALELLYRNMPVFHNLLDKTERGLSDYDPVVFRQYAKVAGVEPWAEECIGQLSGLRDMTNSIRRSAATMQARRSMGRGDPDYPDPPLGRVPLYELTKRAQVQKRYEKRGYDILRPLFVAVDKAAHALGLSAACENDVIKPAAQWDHNPLQPEDPVEARTMRLVSFLASESNRNRGRLPPAAITAAVDQVSYMERAKSSGAASSAQVGH